MNEPLSSPIVYPVQTSDLCPLRAALAATSDLYESVDDALHRLVRVSNQRGCDLEALGRLAGLVDKLEKVTAETHLSTRCPQRLNTIHLSIFVQGIISTLKTSFSVPLLSLHLFLLSSKSTYLSFSPSSSV